MDNKNFFSKHKYLLGLFFITFFIFMFFHCKYALGLFFDIPAMFLGDISQDDTFSKFIVFRENRVRLFSNLLVAIPFNAILLFIKNTTILNILKSFSLSYLIIHIICLISNYLIALRTKRFDIAALGFAFYTFFSIQNMIWVCREVHITVLIYFALLSYFLSKTKLQKTDYIPILLLIIYLFESFEITVIFGLLLFVFAVLYTKKDREEINRLPKVLIGFSGLLVFLYIPLRSIFLWIKEGMDLTQGSNEWIFASKTTITHLFCSNSLITVFAICAFIFIVFYKKTFTYKNIPVIILSSALLIYCLYKITGFIPNPMIEIQNYSFVFWFIFPVILFILAMDYIHKELQYTFLNNLVVISCIIGIIGLSWQINTCFEFNKYTSYLKNLMTNSDEVLISIPQQDFENKSFLNFNTCFGTMHKSIFLSDDYIINKLIIPKEYYPDYSQYCYALEDGSKNYYDSEQNIQWLQTSPLKIKNKYWDISLIKEELENINN